MTQRNPGLSMFMVIKLERIMVMQGFGHVVYSLRFDLPLFSYFRLFSFLLVYLLVLFGWLVYLFSYHIVLLVIDLGIYS